MIASRRTVLGLILLGAACTNDQAGDPASGLELAGDLPASTYAGDTLTVIVRVTGPLAANGRLVWDVRAGNGVLASADEVPGADGLASAQWVLGQVTGANTLTVALGDEPALRVDVAGTAFRAQQVAASSPRYCLIAHDEVWCANELMGSVVGSRRAPQRHRAFTGIRPTSLAVAASGACITDSAGAVSCAEFGSSPTAVSVPALRTIVGSAGPVFCGVARADSTGWCWYGAEGPSAISQVSGTIRFSKIAYGGTYGSAWCGLAIDGTPWCWSPGHPPAPVNGVSDVVDIATLNGEGCVTTASRAVWCWSALDMVPQLEPRLFGNILTCAATDCFIQSGGDLGFLTRFIRPEATPRLPLPFPVLASAPAGQWDHCLLSASSEVYCSINLVGSRWIGDQWGWPQDVFAVPIPPGT